MPRIQQAQLNVELDPLRIPTQNIRTTAADFANPTVDKFLDLAGSMAADYQEKEEADLLLRAETALKDDYRKWETEARSRKGQKAQGVMTEANNWWGEAARKHKDGLYSDRQKQAFDKTIARLRDRSLDTFSVYERSERDKSIEESTRASMKSSAALAANSVGDDEAITTHREDVLQRLEVLRGVKGWTKEQYDLERQEALTSFHSDVIKSAVDNERPDLALEYFNQHKGEMTGTERSAANSLIRESDDLKKAQAGADDLFASGLTEAEAMVRAEKRFSGKTEEKVKQLLSQKYSVADRDRQRVFRDGANQYWPEVIRSKRMPPMSLVGSEISPADWRAMESYLEQDAGGGVKKDDQQLIGTLYSQLSSNDPAERAKFLTEDFRRYSGQLKPETILKFGQMQQDALLPGDPSGVVGQTRQVTAVKNTLPKTKQDAFVLVAEQELTRAANLKGKALTADERQGILDRLLLKETVGTNNYFFEVFGDATKEAEFEADLRSDTGAGLPVLPTDTPGTTRALRAQDELRLLQIPKAERDAITRALERRGLSTAPDAILRLYAEGQKARP